MGVVEDFGHLMARFILLSAWYSFFFLTNLYFLQDVFLIVILFLGPFLVHLSLFVRDLFVCFICFASQRPFCIHVFIPLLLVRDLFGIFLRIFKPRLSGVLGCE